MLLGGTLVVYHNPLRRDTFGPRAVTPQRYVLTDRDGAIKEVAGATLDATHADAIRAGRIARMDVQLG
jgi:hypothetical protein